MWFHRTALGFVRKDLPPNLWWAFPWHLFAAVDPGCYPLALLPESNYRSTWTLCYTVRHTVERRFKPWAILPLEPVSSGSHLAASSSARLKLVIVLRGLLWGWNHRMYVESLALCLAGYLLCNTNYVTIIIILNWFCLMFLVFWPPGMWDLSFPISDRTHTPCIGRWSL